MTMSQQFTVPTTQVVLGHTGASVIPLTGQGLHSADTIFPSLGSAMSGVAGSYILTDGATSGPQGSLAYVPVRHASTAAQDEIRTIFVTGFPDTVHERELHNLCRFVPGYEASQVAFKAGQQPQVFVLFSTAAHARQALEAIAGLPFDTQQQTVRQAQIVEENSNITNGIKSGVDSSAPVSDKSSSLAHALTQNNHTGSNNSITGMGSGNLARLAALVAAGSAHHSNTAQIQQQNSSASFSAQTSSNVGTNSSSTPAVGMDSRTMSGNLQPSSQDMAGALATSGTGLTGVTNPSSSNLGNTKISSPAHVLTQPVKYILRCEMAHKNLFVKENDPSVRRPHRPIVLHNNPGGTSGLASSGGSMTIALAGNTVAPTINTTRYYDLPTLYTAQSPGGTAAGTLHPFVTNTVGINNGGTTTLLHPGSGGLTTVNTMNAASPMGFLPVTNRGDNPPCNTLFIGNLSDQVSELELLQLFSIQPGYRQMKLVRGPRQVSCFVEFDDTPTAVAVHAALQGAVLTSSDRGGIRIQFSKNPFGRRGSTPCNNLQAIYSSVSLDTGTDLSNYAQQAAVATAAAAGGYPVVYQTIQPGISYF